MKSKIIKIISLCMCTAVLVSGSVCSFASGSNKDKQAENATVGQSDKTTEVTAAKADMFKDETVYVIAGADGRVKKIIVSDWLKNTLSSDKITDVTELKNAENIKGDESYTLGGDNTLVWDAGGNDIYYQGTIEKELPVSMTVSYKLDGKTVSPDELAGKSGKVTFRFDYKNNQYEMVKINGKDEKIYVPFAMMTGMMLDNSKFTNIEVSNGKVINDGDRTIVVGLAFPGLQENLDLDREDIEIPSYLEVTADVKDFSLGMTVTVAANIFNEADTEKIDSISDLTGSAADLNDAMSKLLDGSSSLYDGLCTLLDKSGELVSGINKLADGAAKLKSGAYSLDGGAKKLAEGAEDLSAGLDTLAANNSQLNEGAEKVFESLLSTAETQLKAAGISVPKLTVDNYGTVLNGVIDSLRGKIYDEAQKQVAAAVEGKRDYIMSKVTEAVRLEVKNGVTSAVKEQVKAKVTEEVKKEVTAQVEETVRKNVEQQVISAAAGMDSEKYYAAVSAGLVDTATKNAIKSAVDEKMASEEIRTLISSNTEKQMKAKEVSSIISQKIEEQMKTDEIKNIINKNTEEKMAGNDIRALIEQKTEEQIQKAVSENMESQEVQSNIAAAFEDVNKIVSLKDSLNSYNTFYLGLKNYTAGVAQAANGASDLRDGAVQLKNGANTLYNGICSLYDGILSVKNGLPALVSGVTQLKDGAMKLSDGLSQFNEKGIQKLLEKADDVQVLIERLNATIAVSRNYKSFAGISDNTDGNVRFVYRTTEIK